MVIAAVSFLLAVLLAFFMLRSRGDSGQATRSRRSRSVEPSVSTAADDAPSEVETTDELDFEEADEILGLKKTNTSEPSTDASPAQSQLSAEPGKEPQIIALHVMAPSGAPYRGYELLQALLANGLRYGEMQIFHRHETKTGRGKVLFSLASASQPGTFDLPKMGSFSSPGLSLFMLLKPSIDSMMAFDTMLEVAKQLVEDLGGEIWDANRRSLNMDTVADIRAKIRHYEATQPVPDLFADIPLA